MKATYNAITYTGDKSIGAGGFVKYRKISTIDHHVKFISKKYPNWLWITFYNRITNDKQIIKKPEYITPAQNDTHFSLDQT
jgi:hypothetical protein